MSCEAVVERFLHDPHEASLVVMDLDNECAAGERAACDALGVFLLEGEEVEHEPGRALRLLGASCERGSIDACRRIGVYVAARPEGPDDALGLTAARRACDADDPESCLAAGELLHAGRGSARDIEGAVAFFQKGCEAGNDLACRKVADHYVGLNDRASLVQLYESMCDADRPRGCTLLANMFARDHEPEERSRIGELWQRGCTGGDLDGCTHLAVAFVRGDHGIPPDTGQARELLEAGCRAEHWAACAHLGEIEELGIGRRPNPGRARELYTRACERRSGLACYRLGAIERDRRGRSDAAVAVEYFRRACDTGEIPRACGALAAAYDAGRGVEQDPEQAEPLYHMACDGGHPDSCIRLADLVQNDPSRVRAYREKACERRIVEDRCETRAVPPRSYPGRVTQARGPGAPANGSFCAIVYDASADGGHCRLTVRCGGDAIYGGAEEAWASCEVTRSDIVARDFETTPFDGSPQLLLDTGAGTLTVGDVSRRPRSMFVVIEVSEPR